MCHLSRQHPPSRSEQDQAYRAYGNNIVATRSFGFLGELPKVTPGTDTESNLPRLHNQLGNNGSEPSAGKDGCDCQGGKSSSRAAEGFSSISSSNPSSEGDLSPHSYPPF